MTNREYINNELLSLGNENFARMFVVYNPDGNYFTFMLHDCSSFYDYEDAIYYACNWLEEEAN